MSPLPKNSHSYTYGNADWKDLLTACDGYTITYDAIGNPLNYYNGSHWNFTWENGRNLAAATSYGNNITYTYDATGLRTSKTVGAVTYTYYYINGQLRRVTDGTNTTTFFYDESGKPFGMHHNGSVYYYVTNLQGDVLRLTTADGTVVARYKYDPYGKVISATGSMATANPLRYRGYYYDSETGFYYLQSRYYDPMTGRFINADSYVSTGQGVLGNNMFAYCRNNPVCRKDATGTDDICVTDMNDDDTPLNDAGTFYRPGGASGGGNVRGSVGSNSGGLNNGYEKNAGRSVPNKSNKPISPEKVSDAYIKQNNIDAHGFKNQAGGVPRSMLSKYDIYKDKANNCMLWVGTKQFTYWRITNYYFKDLAMVWMKD